MKAEPRAIWETFFPFFGLVAARPELGPLSNVALKGKVDLGGLCVGFSLPSPSWFLQSDLRRLLPFDAVSRSDFSLINREQVRILVSHYR
jgi:hypothetical protein